MSLSLQIHAEKRQQFVCQQVNGLQALFQKWTNTNNLSEDINQSSLIEEQVTQSKTATNNSHFQGFLTCLLSLNNDQLKCQTIKSLQQNFDYMHQVLENELKLYQQRLITRDLNQLEEKKGRQFSKKSKIILKVWLYRHFSYPYPTKEQTIQLSEKQSLQFNNQIQIWFINARVRIDNKIYEKKKFNNIVKYKYFSINKPQVKLR
ncbi:unnamed protein product (macronuclear) [Paramecium tetraurelia]|uniref:Homeobox domain-containing protein n=1 Tax=Paramecium tetraurelia TaxID=5888 RepID=A0DZ03_PARTE|nr:uncharacterized protein GSPATT00003238001 [Paramecium tetraurelia]CAK88270.1 unnamed protein product [Paramecium tetraurelia]|eukprot:XP_001455667.1 hypothetical protein (macronuclear) [Paramecium tetraurelia strain d4-2]